MKGIEHLVKGTVNRTLSERQSYRDICNGKLNQEMFTHTIYHDMNKNHFKSKKYKA